MKTMVRLAGVLAAGCATAVLTSSPALAAAPSKFTFSTSGVQAEAAFSNAPADGNLVAGRVYTDVFVYGADQAVKADGTSFQEDFAFVDVFSYKIDRRGSFVNVSSSFGFAGNDQVAFSGDARGLSSASLTAQVELQTCNDRGCTAAGTEQVSVSWTGTGATTTFKGSFRTNDPGQFTSTGRFTGSSRQATASGTVPVLGTGSAFYGAISSGTSTDRTVCHAC